MRLILTRLLACLAMAAGALHAAALTLDEAYSLSRTASEAVALKELAVQKARLTVNEAASRLWPHVDLQASASYLVNPSQGYTVKAGSLGTIAPAIPAGSPLLNPVAIPLGSFTLPANDFTIGAQLHNYFAASASLAQPLFTWGKIKNAIDLAGLQADAAGNDLVAQKRDIDREVHRAYFGALTAQDSLAILQRIRDAAAATAADRQSSFDQGTITRETLLEAVANLASVDAKLAEAEQSKATAMESLGLLTGLDPASITLASDFRASLPTLDEERLRARALEASTDLAATRTAAGLARKKLAIERGASILLPDVSLGVRVEVSGQEDLPFADWSWDNASWNWDVAVSVGVKMSVFDGLASANRIGQAEKDVAMAGTGLSQQTKLVRLDVRKAVDAAEKADAAVAEKQAAAEYAEERLRGARVALDNGVASRDDLHGADILAGSAELDLLLARYTREEALADIERLTGDRF
jgi:outer membrane protein TolC